VGKKLDGGPKMQIEIRKARGIDEFTKGYTPGKVEEEKTAEVSRMSQDERIYRNNLRFDALSIKENFPHTTIFEAHLTMRTKCFSSVQDYFDYLATKAGFPNETDYRKYLSIEAGFGQWGDYATHLYKKYDEYWFYAYADLYMRVVIDKEFD